MLKTCNVSMINVMPLCFQQSVSSQLNYCLLCTAVDSCVRWWFNWLCIDWWKHNWLTSIKWLQLVSIVAHVIFCYFCVITRSLPSAYHYTSQWFTTHPVFHHLYRPHPLYPVSFVGTLLGLFDPEDESTTVVQTVANYPPNNKMLQPRRLEFSAAPL